MSFDILRLKYLIERYVAGDRYDHTAGKPLMLVIKELARKVSEQE